MKFQQKMKDKENLLLLGHKGLIGSALLKILKKRRYKKIITIEKNKVDLLSIIKLDNFFKKVKPKKVIIAAARVGGIVANKTYPFNFIYENMVIQNNIFSMCIKYNCKKVIFLGSSCIYPKKWVKPFTENDLMMSDLEKTNEYYAIAKISGLKLCEAYNKQYEHNVPKFITVIPPNLFGENDNYNYKNSHVLAALLRKFYEAKQSNSKSVEVWGTGRSKREFLYSEDAANMIVDILESNNDKILKFTKGQFSHINIGTGKDYSINQIAQIIKEITRYRGKIVNNLSYPDGVKRKVLNIDLFKKISPKSINNKILSRNNLKKQIKNTFLKLNPKILKKFDQNNSFNLPI